MACACLKASPVKSGLMALGSVVASAVIIGGMMLGLHLTGPADPNHMTLGQGVVLTVVMAAACWFPLWVPYKVEDFIDDHC